MASLICGRNNNENNTNRFSGATRLTIAAWNIRTLLDRSDAERPQRRTALIAAELKKYNIDIAVLSETRLAGEGSLVEEGEGYTYFWRGLPEDNRRIHGVGIAIKNDILRNISTTPRGISERLIIWRIPLERGQHMTVLGAYAPTLDAEEEVKDRFYGLLQDTLHSISANDKLVLVGDFNARVGNSKNLWGGVLGSHGVGKCNANGLRLLSLCAENNLVITNTLFKLRNMHKTTWMHPRSKKWHLIDYIITRKADSRDFLITKVMRGADGCTDHRMVRSKLRVHLRTPVRKSAPSAKLNVGSLKENEIREQLKTKLRDQLNVVTEETFAQTSDMLTERWTISSTINEVSRTVLGTMRKKNRDWFDEQRQDIQVLLNQRNHAHKAKLQVPNDANQRAYAETRSRLQRELRVMENEWWTRLAAEIQDYADSGNQQQFYSAVKAAYGARQGTKYPVRAADGEELLTDRSEVLQRWAEHYRQLLSQQATADLSIVEEFPEQRTLNELDLAPSLEEVEAAIKSQKTGKAAGPDGVPGEVLLYGGAAVVQCMYSFISAVWTAGEVPQQWKDADIISIYKKKGDRAVCGNSRGIALLSSGGKVLTRIILSRLIHSIAEDVLPESQCGFRKNRSTTDMVFVARQLQEKCIEQHGSLYMVFVDLTKAFDTINRPLMWMVLERLGCPPNFLGIIRSLHEGAMARVMGDGAKSDPFEVCAGVRQGCVVAPVLFNLFIAAVFSAAKRHMEPGDGVNLRYRLDGSLFNLRRLRATTKVSFENIVELQYADDAAIVASSRVSLQRSLGTLESAYSRAGLKINTDKTEALSTTPIGVEPATFYINNTAIKNVDTFTYLGSVLNKEGGITDDVQRRIGLASAAFGRLSERVFLNKNLRLDTKVKVYKAICLSTLLYSSEGWTLYREHLKMLERYHIQCLQRMLGLRWWHKVPHTEIRRRAGIEPLEALVIMRQLRWAGHVRRMPENRLPRQTYYGELAEGVRSVGGQRKRHKDMLARHLRKCNINVTEFERLADDRSEWRTVTRAGIDTYKQNYDQLAEGRRARRHLPPREGERHVCNVCGRVCKARIGLISHQRTHNAQRRE